MTKRKDQFWGLTRELDRSMRSNALHDWSLESVFRTEAQVAAFRLVVAIGKCLIFGVSTTDSLDGTINLSIADAAVRRATEEAAMLEIAIQEMESDLESADSDLELHFTALTPLEWRVNLYAFCIAIEEARTIAKLHGQNEPALFSSRVEFLKLQLVDIDELIQEEGDLFTPALETFWLTNLDRDLADNAWRPRPWWLSDEMNQRHRQIRALTIAIEQAGLETLTLAVSAESPVGEDFVEPASSAFFENMELNETKDPQLALGADKGQPFVTQVVFLGQNNEVKSRLDFQTRANLDKYRLSDLLNESDKVCQIHVAIERGSSEPSTSEFWLIQWDRLKETIELKPVFGDLVGKIRFQPIEISNVFEDKRWLEVSMTRVG